jgi:autotransporter adhesin
MKSGCDVHLKQYKSPNSNLKTQMNGKNPKQRVAFVSNSKKAVMHKIRCSGLDSMSFVAVAAGPKIGAWAIEASQPVDSATANTSEIRDQAALKRGRSRVREC